VRVLLTGASGLVGRASAVHLADAGWEVVGLARRPTGGAEFTQELAADLGSPVVADAVAAATEPCDAIVHAAASRERHDHSPEIALTNCLGSQQMLSLAELWKVERFVFISGVTVIGRPRVIPITEAHPAAPLSAYHASKLYGEHLVTISQARSLGGVSLRLTAPVGPRMPDERLLKVFIRRALSGEPLTVAGSGTRRQNYLDVRDAAGAIDCALKSAVTGIVNVGGQAAISNRELAELCVTLLDSPSAIRFGGDDPEEGLDWDVSLARAETELGFVPEHALADSIRGLAAELRSG